MSILVDYSNIARASIAVAERTGEADFLAPHYILGKIRQYNSDFRKKYGELIICADHYSWRNDVFPHYKIRRKNARAQTPEDEEANEKIYELVKNTYKALDEYSHFRCVRTHGAEGDDVIAVLARQPGTHVVITADKDMSQLKSNNVDIYQPIMKEFRDNGPDFLMSLILSGDGGDDIPNILSPDTFFYDKIYNESNVRQKSITKKIREPLIGAIDPFLEIDELPEVNGVTKEEIKKNFKRNDLLINFKNIPDYVVADVMKVYNEQADKKGDMMKLLQVLKAGSYISKMDDFVKGK